MTTHPKVPDDLLKMIRQGNRFLLTSHANPDGDAIGSELGLARLLRGLGKGAVVWNRDDTPTVYRAMPGAERIHTGAEPPSGFPDRFDGIVVLECPSLDRGGLEEVLVGSGLPLANVDHHLGNQHYGSVNWVDPAAPAVGEMVFRLAQALKVPLGEEVANALFLCLVTDTGGFRFSNATVAAFEAAAALVAEGAQPALVSRWLYESRPEASVRLLGRMLDSLELHAGGRIATALLTGDMYAAAAATHSDAEGLIDHPRSIAGVEAVALVREIDGGGSAGAPRSKVSLRSRGEVDVEKIARRHGGGGHKNAAGYEADGAPPAVAAEAVEALSEALESAPDATATAEAEA